jgi:hypothetical protein
MKGNLGANDEDQNTRLPNTAVPAFLWVPQGREKGVLPRRTLTHRRPRARPPPKGWAVRCGGGMQLCQCLLVGGGGGGKRLVSHNPTGENLGMCLLVPPNFAFCNLCTATPHHGARMNLEPSTQK